MKLDAELHRSLDDDVMQTGGRDHLLLAGTDRSDMVPIEDICEEKIMTCAAGFSDIKVS